MVNDWLSFFGVDMPTEQGLFFLEPYQPGKIPVVMVHGNHEGFEHLQTLYPRRRRPTEPVPLESLFGVQ